MLEIGSTVILVEVNLVKEKWRSTLLENRVYMKNKSVQCKLADSCNLIVLIIQRFIVKVYDYLENYPQ